MFASDQSKCLCLHVVNAPFYARSVIHHVLAVIPSFVWRSLLGLFAVCVTLTAGASEITYHHDAQGRLTGATYDDGTVVTYTYDANGNRTGAITSGVARGNLRFSASSYSGGEASGLRTVTVSVQRTGGSYGAAGVSYATNNGTAVAPGDYAATSGTLTWAHGDAANKTFTVTIANDSSIESTESFGVTLSGASGATLGSLSTATISIIDDDADVTAPSAPGTPAFSSITAISVTASWAAATDTIGVTGYQYRLNGGSWQTLGNVLSASLTGLTQVTSYTFDVRARDAAGNWGNASSGSFTTLDGTPPSVPGTPTFSAVQQTSATVTWNAATDNVGVTSYQYRVNGGSWNTLGNVLTTSLTNLTADTQYTVNVRARDAQGNWGAASAASFTTLPAPDTTPPGAPGTPAFSSITGTSATAAWTAASDNVGVTGYEYRLNSGSWTAIGNVLTRNLTSLSSGVSYTFELRAFDAAGNRGTSRSGSFTTEDTQAPSAPGAVTFSSVTMTSATANWGAASDNVGVTGYRYRINSGTWHTLGVVASVGLSGLSASTTYAFEIQARDAAGNWGGSRTKSFTTPDTQAPVAPGALSFSNITMTSATVSWGAASDNVGVTGYRYSVNSGAWQTLGNVTAVSLTGLSAATSYTVKVQARDAAGNWSTTRSGSFTTPDTQAPSTPTGLSFSSVAMTSAIASWNGASDNVGVTGYRYRLNASAWSTLGNVTTVGLSGLSAATAYTMQLQARDAAGNWSSTASASFTTPDTQPPTAPGTPNVSSITLSSATLSWGSATDNDAINRYEYRLGSSGAFTSVGLAQSVNLTGLSAATTYTFAVRAVDASGNVGSTASKSFSTALPAITLPSTYSFNVGAPGGATAQFWITSGGDLKRNQSGTSTQLDFGDWLSPKVAMSNFEVIAIPHTGTCKGAALNTWQSLASTRTWYMSVSGSRGATASCAITLQIRRIGTTSVLGSGIVAIVAVGY